MNYLEEFKNNLLQSNKSLEKKKEQILKKFIDIDINNVLSQINDITITYFHNMLNELSLNENELFRVEKMFQYYDIIKGFKIDINNLFFEDKNIKEFKDTVIFICQCIADYKNNIFSNIDSEINRNNITITTIIKIKELINNKEIDLDIIYDLINSLPINNEEKENIYKEIYLKQIENLKKKTVLIEEPIIEQEIIDETEDLEEETLEQEGIRFKITEEDLKLQNNIELLCDNLRKLKIKMQSIEISNEKENKEYVKDKKKIDDLLEKANNIKEEIVTYLEDKNEVWNDEEYNEEELNSELVSIYNNLINNYNNYNKIYLKLYNKYITKTNSLIAKEETEEEIEEYPPIIFWMGNNRIIGPTNTKRIDEGLNQLDNYPEANFYGNRFLPALKKLKKASEMEKVEGLNTKPITKGVDIPFWEVRLHPGKGGTARIYYDYMKSKSGKEYKVVYLIVNKKEDFDKDSYDIIQEYIKGKAYAKLPELLDNEEIIEKFQILEDSVFEKVKKRKEKEENKQIEKEKTQDETKKTKKTMKRDAKLKILEAKKEALESAKNIIQTEGEVKINDRTTK